jgi:hypothetical protein
MNFSEDMDYTFTSDNGREYGVIINPDGRRFSSDEIPDLDVYLVWQNTQKCRLILPNERLDQEATRAYFEYMEELLSEY